MTVQSPEFLRPAPGARREWIELPASVEPHFARLDDAARAALQPVLWDDVVSEYDARFFSAHLRTLDWPLSERFWEVEAEWARDEERHFTQFARVTERLFPFDRAVLEKRCPDFGPLEELFGDEFAILCLGAYDELVTVQAYRKNLVYYDSLGLEMGRYARSVIADEAWHYARFLEILRSEHAQEMARAPEVVARIRRCEGISYAATFVLDHDDRVFTKEMYDGAVRVLLAQLGRA
jgi:hypothetical protein